VEKLVRNVQETDWERVRLDAEQKLAGAWSSVRQSEPAKEVEGRAKELGEQVRMGVKDTVSDGKGRLLEVVDTSKAKVREAADVGGKKMVDTVAAGREKLEELGQAGKEKVEQKTVGRPKRLLEIA
jgi:uncharacterized membrane protein